MVSASWRARRGEEGRTNGVMMGLEIADYCPRQSFSRVTPRNRYRELDERKVF